MSKIFEFTDESKNIPEWKDNLEGISSNHTQVTGVLAGFSFTAVVLVSTCPDRSMNPFLAEATFGLFLMAF